MAKTPESIVRGAFDAFFSGEIERLRTHVDPALEWTFLDPSEQMPLPRTCFGREELERAAAKWAKSGLVATLEELEASGKRVTVVIHAPGLDRSRERAAGDRSFYAVRVSDGLVVAIRACLNREDLVVTARLL